MCLRGHDNLCIDTAYPGHQVFGGYAEYIVRRQDAVLPIPDGVDFETAAATLWSYTTPVNCAVRRAPVGIGDTVVITGASGGMATACAQLAKLSGATVIGTTTKLDRDDQLKTLGYDHILHSTDPEMPNQVRELTRGLGADAVWDCVGGTAFLQLSVACVRLGGTVIVLGAPFEQGFDLEVNGLAFIFKRTDGRRRSRRHPARSATVHGTARGWKDQPGHRPRLPLVSGGRGTRLPGEPAPDRQGAAPAVTRETGSPFPGSTCGVRPHVDPASRLSVVCVARRHQA